MQMLFTAHESMSAIMLICIRDNGSPCERIGTGRQERSRETRDGWINSHLAINLPSLIASAKGGNENCCQEEREDISIEV